MTIIISTEFEIILDENYKIIGEARKDITTLDLTPITKKVKEITMLSNELIKSLDPNTVPVKSRPGREGVYKTAGILTNTAIGFILGALIFSLAALVFISKTDPSIIQALFGG